MVRLVVGGVGSWCWCCRFRVQAVPLSVSSPFPLPFLLSFRISEGTRSCMGVFLGVSCAHTYSFPHLSGFLYAGRRHWLRPCLRFPSLIRVVGWGETLRGRSGGGGAKRMGDQVGQRSVSGTVSRSVSGTVSRSVSGTVRRSVSGTVSQSPSRLTNYSGG